VNVAVIFAGGIGARMNSRAVPKQFLEIHGKPVIIHTLEHFEEHPDIAAIAIAIVPDYRDHLARLLHRYELAKVRWVVDGGETGQLSRHRALQAVAVDCPADTIVLIHDGVRPLIDADLITRNIASVVAHGSCITCTKITETVVSSSDDRIDDVIPREHVYTAQAPQSFRLGEILDLYDRAIAEGASDIIDSCTLMHRYGREIHRIDGPRSNIKITTPEDYYICRTFFEIIEDRQLVGL
jgi:2-C-methyl-D-erythritol 4-phosphate cytidylyltransferase